MHYANVKWTLRFFDPGWDFWTSKGISRVWNGYEVFLIRAGIFEHSIYYPLSNLDLKFEIWYKEKNECYFEQKEWIDARRQDNCGWTETIISRRGTFHNIGQKVNVHTRFVHSYVHGSKSMRPIWSHIMMMTTKPPSIWLDSLRRIYTNVTLLE
jgi:hypothetical protein